MLLQFHDQLRQSPLLACLGELDDPDESKGVGNSEPANHKPTFAGTLDRQRDRSGSAGRHGLPALRTR